MKKRVVERIIKPRQTFSLPWRKLWDCREVLLTLIKRDLSLRYRYAWLGASWAIFQPFAIMLAFVLIFGRIDNIGGDYLPYPIYLFSGLIFWSFFTTILSRSSSSLTSNKSLVTKIYFPRLIIPLSSIAVAFVDLFFAFLVLILMISIFQINFHPIGFILLLPVIFIIFITSLGLGLFFAVLQIKYNDTKRLLPFFSQLLFFLTPVFYSKDLIPTSFHWLLYINPLAGALVIFRRGMFSANNIPLEALFISTASSLVILFLGLLYFGSNEDEIVDKI